MRWFSGFIILALLAVIILKESPSQIELNIFLDSKIVYGPALDPWEAEYWVNGNCFSDKLTPYLGWDYWQDACNRRYSNWL